MIGRIIADASGLTEKLGSQRNGKFEEIHQIKVENTEWNKFQQDVKAAKGDTVRIKTAIDNTALKNLRKVEGLYDYAVKQSNGGKNVGLKQINNLIQTQNYKNIADQAHGFLGVNTAIKEYNKLTDNASRSKFSEGVSRSNASLGKYLEGFNVATAGIGNYAKFLALATLKTTALHAATTVLNTIISMGMFAVISGAISAITQLINRENNMISKAQELSGELKSLSSDIESYKNKIEDARKVMESSNSSIKEMTNSRQTLMSIQIGRAHV